MLRLLFSLHPPPQAPVVLRDEVPDRHNPAVALWKRLIELAGNLGQLVQTRPRNGREIVVLVVQANVAGEEVERSVVRVGFRWGNFGGGALGGSFVRIEDGVLGDE